MFQIVLMASYLITTTLPTCVPGTLLELDFALCVQLINTVHPVCSTWGIYIFSLAGLGHLLDGERWYIAVSRPISDSTC